MKMVKTLPEFEYLFTVFFNNKNFFSKMRISKVTDYAALICCDCITITKTLRVKTSFLQDPRFEFLQH